MPRPVRHGTAVAVARPYVSVPTRRVTSSTSRLECEGSPSTGDVISMVDAAGSPTKRAW